MSNNLKCPFCGTELKKIMGDLLKCTNENCDGIMFREHKDIQQSLIFSKKARDALKIVDGKLKVIANDENPSSIQSQALDCYIQIAQDCRGTIASITKQENE